MVPRRLPKRYTVRPYKLAYNVFRNSERRTLSRQCHCIQYSGVEQLQKWYNLDKYCTGLQLVAVEGITVNFLSTLQGFGQIQSIIRENCITPSTFKASQKFQARFLPIQQLIFCSKLDHRIFTRYLVCKHGHV